MTAWPAVMIGGDGVSKGEISVDEVELFNRALQLLEIKSISDARSAGKCKCANPPMGMVAWWPLDEPATSIAVTDIAGNNDGTSKPAGISIGGPTSVPAQVHTGFRFCGAPPAPTFVTVNDKPTLDFGLTQSFSIDAWIKTSGTASFQMIVDKLNWPNPSGGYRFYVDSGNVLKLDIAGGAVSGTTVLTPGNWYHVAVKVDRPNHQVIFCVNGTTETVRNDTTFLNASSSGLNLLIGGTHETQLTLGCEYVLDEVEIFNVAVSPSDISAIYHAGSAGKCEAQTCVVKFYDHNQNGVQDIGEPPLAGWTFNVTDQNNILVGAILTYHTGVDIPPACRRVPAPGTYTITEHTPPGWTLTTPNPRTATVSPGQTVNFSFGNWLLPVGRGRAVRH
jgi:hypothetical protein